MKIGKIQLNCRDGMVQVLWHPAPRETKSISLFWRGIREMHRMTKNCNDIKVFGPLRISHALD